MQTTKEFLDAETMAEFERKKQQAVATFLGVRAEQLIEIRYHTNKILAVVEISHRGLSQFVEEMTPPFKTNDRVIPYTCPMHPRGGGKGDELSDNRKRTVQRVSFDRNTMSWWILVKGKKFPFSAKNFQLAPRS